VPFLLISSLGFSHGFNSLEQSLREHTPFVQEPHTKDRASETKETSLSFPVGEERRESKTTGKGFAEAKKN
jgi:hypothetical protein